MLGIIELRYGGDVMVFTIINANLEFPEINDKLTEFIYELESINQTVHYILLKNIHDTESCENIGSIVRDSDVVIYISPLDSEISQNRLNTYLEHYKDHHPNIFLIVDSKDLLSVETVSNYIDKFENFADKHHTRVIDVQYYKDALESLKNITERRT